MFRWSALGGKCPPPEDTADHPDFTPEGAHLFLHGFYGDVPYQNYGSHLDGGIKDDALWQCHWRQIAAQSASWSATPSGAVGRRLMEILDAE